MTGYLVGCCEAAEYILYVASAVVEIGRLLTVITELSPSFEPLYWISFYAISLVIQMKGGRTFWRFNAVIAIITLLLIVMYCLASLPNVNFAKFAISEKDHEPGTRHLSRMFEEIFHFFPLVSWFYVGVESMTLSCDDIPQANRRVPWMMVCSMLTLLVTSTSIVLTSCSQAPGTTMLPFADLPLSPGYAHAFHYASPRFLAILAMPGTFSTSFGFMFAYGRQLKAMARSGLLPGYLGQAWGAESVPLTALLTGSIIGCSVLLFLWLLVPKAIDRLFGLCMLSSCTVYVAIFASFLIARTRLDTVPRTFVSPFGRVGALYGMSIFGLMAIALAVFQKDNYVSVIVYVVAIVCAVIHYALIARKREFLSLEEQAQFMKAYLLHSDAEYRRRMVRRSFANKHAFLRKVAPFSTQRFGGLSQRWHRGNLTAPVELLDGLDETAVATGGGGGHSLVRATATSSTGEGDSATAAALAAGGRRDDHRATVTSQAFAPNFATRGAQATVSFDAATMSLSSRENTILLQQQQQSHDASGLKPHQLHLQSSLLSSAQLSADAAMHSQAYNANQHQMTLDLEAKMRKLAEEIFAGQDEGQVTVVRSRHGRRALTFRWREAPGGGPGEVKVDDSAGDGSAKAVDTRSATATATVSSGSGSERSQAGIDRIIRLAETDTAVEIIPGLAEEIFPPDDAYNFYPQHRPPMSESPASDAAATRSGPPPVSLSTAAATALLSRLTTRSSPSPSTHGSSSNNSDHEATSAGGGASDDELHTRRSNSGSNVLRTRK